MSVHVSDNGDYFLFTRNSTDSLSNNFNSREFLCHCGTCVKQKISIKLIKALQRVREEIAQPIKIHSAFRCEYYQNQLKAKGYQTAVGKSTHELGDAVDVSSSDMAKLFVALEKEFKSIGIARTFYHVDMRADKVRRWNYV